MQFNEILYNYNRHSEQKLWGFTLNFTLWSHIYSMHSPKPHARKSGMGLELEKQLTFQPLP